MSSDMFQPTDYKCVKNATIDYIHTGSRHHDGRHQMTVGVEYSCGGQGFHIRFSDIDTLIAVCGGTRLELCAGRNVRVARDSDYELIKGVFHIVDDSVCLILDTPLGACNADE